MSVCIFFQLKRCGYFLIGIQINLIKTPSANIALESHKRALSACSLNETHISRSLSDVLTSCDYIEPHQIYILLSYRDILKKNQKAKEPELINEGSLNLSESRQFQQISYLIQCQ